MKRRSDEQGESGRVVGGSPLSLIREFIGDELLVLECPAKSFRGMKGKIVDETKNTFVVETGGRERKIPKKGAVFLIGGDLIHGDEIMFRAEDRPRKLKKKIR